MITFARVVDSATTDICIGADAVSATSAAFPTNYIQQCGGAATWKIVPDGTQDNATVTLDQNGNVVTATVPVIPSPQPVPQSLSGVEFHNYCAESLATVNATSPTQGIARLGMILANLEAARAQSGLLMIAWVRYSAAGGPGGRYSFGDVQTLVMALQAAGIMTTPEATAIVDGWPQTTA